MVWIYGVPTWLFMSASVLVACALSGAALGIVRKRIARNDLITHNDVAGPILATIGTILAVMMSFMVVGVWQEYDSSAQNVQNEASALSDLHHLADAFQQPLRNRIKAKVDKYILDVVNVEWPLMRSGGESMRVHSEAYEIESVVTHIDPSNPRETNLQQAALDITTHFLDDRRQRLHDNRQGIPMTLWATMLLVGTVTILFSFYFRVDRSLAQHIMVLALTCVISITFALIAELDFPFRGDLAVSPDAFVHVYDTLHNIGLR